MGSSGIGRDAAFGGGVVVLSSALLAARARSGWIPHDEGLLAQSAERVLRGELPHRDFDAAYTGGLELLHAAAFRLLGEDLSTLRWTLLAFSVPFVLALYVLARRAAEPPMAAALSLTAVAWSLPNYFAALPSWYVLFFWTFGGVALLAFSARRSAGFLVVAGTCAGLAFLAKTPGILLLGVCFLYVVFDDQVTAMGEAPAPPGRAMIPVLGTALAVLVGGLVALVSRQLGAMELLLYVVPTAAIASLLLRIELRLRGGAGRVRRVLRRSLALAAGAAVPIALFLLPYAMSGSLGDFWRGTFVLPQRRFDRATFPLPPLWTAMAALPLAVPVAFPAAFRRLGPRALAAGAGLAGVVLLATSRTPEVYRAIWYAVRPLTPVAVVLGCLTLARREARELEGARGGILLLALAALIGLLQFPYAFAVYFCYTAPFVVLAFAWTVRERGRRELDGFYALVLAFFAAFALLWLHPGFVRALGAEFVANPQGRLLRIPRAGLVVPEEQADLYEAVVAEVELHSAPGDYVYAAPDCPEIHFLTGRQNPTRTFYDAFDADVADPRAREDRLLRTLGDRQVRVVVLSAMPEFSARISPSLLSALRIRYPSAKKIGHFLVMWRP